MKKKTYIIYILLICSAVLLFSLVKSVEQRKNLQNSIDYAYMQQLHNVLGSLSLLVEEYSYRLMISSVYSVSQMSELTSYEKINDDLDISLHYLYISLREEKSKEKVLARIEELHDIFFIMVQDPTSKEATNRLFEIANETFFKVPD